MLNKVLKSKYFKLAVLLFVIAAFVVYFYYNRNQFDRLSLLTWWQVLLIIFGQTIVILSNVLILMIIVLYLGQRLKFIDSARITAYSSLVNFFGFLQGGLGLRAIYLKNRYEMTIRRYVALTVQQYLLVFGVATLMIAIGLASNGTFLSTVLFAICVVILVVIVWQIIKTTVPKLETKLRSLYSSVVKIFAPRLILLMFLAVILQLGGSVLASGVELYAIGAHVTPAGLLIYSGLAQFAVLFAITPGAIGIREGILLAAQNQIHLTTNDIVLAATVDRVLYFVTLGIITPLAIGARKIKNLRS